MNIGSVLIVGIAIVAVAAALYGWVILTVDAYRDRRDRDNEDLPRFHEGGSVPRGPREIEVPAGTTFKPRRIK